MNQPAAVQLAQEPAKLLQAWHQLQIEHIGPLPLRSREAAWRLGTTEAQLIAARCGQGVTRLNIGDFQEFIAKLPSLGKIMSLARNESAIHVAKGEYDNITFEGPGKKIGVVANGAIDLRIFLYGWAIAFAVTDVVTAEEQRAMQRKNDTATQALVTETLQASERYSLQFFNKYGVAIQKISLLPEGSNKEAYDALISQYRDANQDPTQEVEIAPITAPMCADSEIDIEEFRQTWSTLKDTHDFYPMIKKFGVQRHQALRLGGEQWATSIDPNSVRLALEQACATELPIMVFVGNDNILQIHTGNIQRVKTVHGWLIAFDENFNLYLLEKTLQEGTAWRVRKPSVDGIITSIELFDKNEQLVVTLFGKRKPGIPEDLQWRALAEGLV